LSKEALACRDGVALAADLGVQKLKIETDSQELVNLWKMGDNQRSCIAPIIRDRSAVFVAFSLVYANRSCNHVAHVCWLSRSQIALGWVSGNQPRPVFSIC